MFNFERPHWWWILFMILLSTFTAFSLLAIPFEIFDVDDSYHELRLAWLLNQSIISSAFLSYLIVDVLYMYEKKRKRNNS